MDRKGIAYMSVLYILLPLGLLIAGSALIVFIWAARDGQFDDLETPTIRMLQDDDRLKKSNPKELPPDKKQSH